MNHQPKIYYLARRSFEEKKGGVQIFETYLRRIFPQMKSIILSDCKKDSLLNKINLERISLELPKQGVMLSRRFLEFQRRDPADLLFVSNILGWYLSLKKLNIPIIHVYHGTLIGFFNNAVSKKKKSGNYYASKYLYPFFDKLGGRKKTCVSVSWRTHEEVKNYYGLDSVLIPNGIDLNVFKPSDKRESRELLGLPQDKPIGIFVGRLGSIDKGFDILLEVIKVFPEILFLIVSEDKAENLPPNVILRRDIKRDELPSAFSASDFFIQPSRSEACSFALLEAMACNLPVVANEVVWPLASKPENIGFFLKKNEPSEYINAIKQLLHSKHHFNSRAIAEKEFSFELFSSRYRSLVDQVLKKSPADINESSIS